jgi:hypothetical protein
VTTASGIRAVVTARWTESSVEIVADAIESEATMAFDEAYAAQLTAYIRRVEQHGMAAAGEPPHSGANIYLSEIEIIPPEQLRGIGRLVRWSGGTGSEWTTRWFWDSCQPEADWTFEVRVESGSSFLVLQ